VPGLTEALGLVGDTAGSDSAVSQLVATVNGLLG
jgi:hypothetical protein